MILTAIAKGILYLLGFTAEGIRYGSIAAMWMAKIGVVATKSFFSLLQSFAMR